MKRGIKGKKGTDKKKKKETTQVLKTVGVWVWAQCDNDGCQKWRKLPPGTVVNDNEPWFCYMNPNEDMNDCSIPEEEYNELTEAAVYSHPPSKHQSSDEDYDYDTQAAWGNAKKPAKRRKSSNDLTAKLELRTEDNFGKPGTSTRQTRPRTANRHLQMFEDTFSSSEEGGYDQEEQEGEEGKALQNARGIVKARRTHTGLRKLLARGGVWEIVKGKGRAVTAPPAWVWEGLATHAPDSARLACRAADASSAARYFEIAQAPQGSQQACRAADNARLSLTVAAALAVQETSRIPGIEDSPVSGDSSGGGALQPLEEMGQQLPGSLWGGSEAELQQDGAHLMCAKTSKHSTDGQHAETGPTQGLAPLEEHAPPEAQLPPVFRNRVNTDFAQKPLPHQESFSEHPVPGDGHVGVPSADLDFSGRLESSQSINALA